jgi:hypothetical protein
MDVENARDLSQEADFIEALYAINPVRTQALLSQLDLPHLAERISTQWDLFYSGRLVEGIAKVDPVKARALVAALDVPRISRCSRRALAACRT